MNRIAVVTLTASLLTAGLSAQRSQEELKERYAHKLESSWLKNANWQLDYQKALATAKKENKVVFAYFTRSYAP